MIEWLCRCWKAVMLKWQLMFCFVWVCEDMVGDSKGEKEKELPFFTVASSEGAMIL